MKPEQFVSATADKGKGTVVLTSHYYKLMALGATVPVSARRGEWVDSFSIYLDPNGEGPPEEQLIAILATGSQNGEGRPFLIPLKWDKKDYAVDLVTPFVPLAGRLLQIHNGFLEVRVESDLVNGTELFTTDPKADGQPGMRYVPDGDLFCRYALDQAEVRDLLVAASAHVEVVSLNERLAAMTNQENSYLSQSCLGLAQRDAFQVRCVQMAFGLLRDAATSKGWGLRKRIEEALARIPDDFLAVSDDLELNWENFSRLQEALANARRNCQRILEAYTQAVPNRS